MPRPPRATIDFETKSVLNLKKVGAWLYSKHPSTEVLCMAYHVPGMSEVKLWHPALSGPGGFHLDAAELPYELFEWVERGGLVEAHNSFFEMCIWANVIRRTFADWPAIKFTQWRCTAARAAACSLPRSLEGANAALNLQVRKDDAGKYLIRKYCLPRRFGKKEKENMRKLGDDPNIPQFHLDDGIKNLFAYCRQDVRAEMKLSDNIPDLSEMETRVWQITQRINARGLLIDTELAEAALKLAAKAKKELTAELHRITGEEFNPSQRAIVRKWLNNNSDDLSFNLTDTKAKTIEWYLRKADLDDTTRRVLTILKEANRTSPKKYQRMLEHVGDDGRARDNLLYCGAERTGRFAGKGIQVHNLPKGKLAKGQTMDSACADVIAGDYDHCAEVHGDVMNLVVSCLRGAIIAPPGRQIWAADYSAIEARCVLWESGATAALEVFRTGGDIYCDMASAIFNREITKATSKVITALGATERDFGKVAVLGLGYGMGYLKFLITLRTFGIYFTRAEIKAMLGAALLEEYEEIVRKKLWPKISDYMDEDGKVSPKMQKRFELAKREGSLAVRALAEERENAEAILHELALCKYTVDTYREKYSEVPQMWKDQEAAAIRAVNSNKAVRCGVVVWKVVGRFLKCKLPSGRCLNYCDPEVKSVKTSWGETRPSLRFMGIQQTTRKWVRQHTYGGKLTENITQAIARDIMAHAKINIDDFNKSKTKNYRYDLMLSVHDELLAETPEGAGDREEFESLMCNLPAAYEGCPITAEAKSFTRYRKG